MRLRVVAATMLPLLLTACGAPTGLIIMSYAFDGATFIATGKRVSDHALSALLQRDCAVLHIVKGQELCLDPVETVAEGEPTMVAGDDFGTAPMTLASWTPPDVQPTDPSEPGADHRARRYAVDRPARFMVIGSFLDPANAEALRRRHDALAPIVVPAIVEGRRFHRVVTRATGAELAANGISEAWPVMLCASGLGPPPCHDGWAYERIEMAARAPEASTR